MGKLTVGASAALWAGVTACICDVIMYKIGGVPGSKIDIAISFARYVFGVFTMMYAIVVLDYDEGPITVEHRVAFLGLGCSMIIAVFLAACKREITPKAPIADEKKA